MQLYSFMIYYLLLKNKLYRLYIACLPAQILRTLSVQSSDLFLQNTKSLLCKNNYYCDVIFYLFYPVRTLKYSANF